MKSAIATCIEQMEAKVLTLEATQAPSADDIQSAMNLLGLTHLKLPSAQVVALMDMLAEGIQPVTPELVTALLGICEAHKRLLYAMAGLTATAGAESGTPAPEVQPEAPLGTEQPAVTTDMNTPPEKGTTEEAPEEQNAQSNDSDMDGATEEPPSSEAALPSEEPAQAPAKDTAAAKTEPKPKEQGKPKKDGIVSVRVNTEKLDNLIDMIGKLMVTYAVISQNKNLDSATMSGLREMDMVIGRIKSEVDHIRLVPLKQIFMPLHRLVTSTAQKVQKKIELVIQGDDLELDKMIVENLNEPLVHMLRNAVDHGVEPPDDRKTTGKPESGVVTLKAWRKGDFAYISVSDDGRGLDPARIRRKAEERGLLEHGKEYSDTELYQFIMASGFSTAEQVTDISGRGVGMDAVLNVVREQLGGDIHVDSTLGSGSSFLISVPLDRSVNEGIVDALITRVGEETFVIPSRDVVEVFASDQKDMVEMPDGSRAVSVRGEIHPIIPLSDYFGIPSRPAEDGYIHTIVVSVGNTNAALQIDEVISQQQAVVTSFTIPVQDIYQIPILGYGMLGETDALVVDVENLIDRLKTTEGSLGYRTLE